MKELNQEKLEKVKQEYLKEVSHTIARRVLAKNRVN